MSVYSIDIKHIVSFKKLHVTVYNLPYYLSELDIKSSVKKQLWLNFWDEIHDNSYFYDHHDGVIQIKCVKLANYIYYVKTPVINSSVPVISYVITS